MGNTEDDKDEALLLEAIFRVELPWDVKSGWTHKAEKYLGWAQGAVDTAVYKQRLFPVKAEEQKNSCTCPFSPLPMVDSRCLGGN